MRVINHVINLKTASALDFINVTKKIEEIVKRAKIKNGIINIQSLHTTMAILVNEAEPLLISDFKALLKKIAPNTYKYAHDNFKIRTVNLCDGECVNGQAHYKAIHLPTAVMLNIIKNRLQLGVWQQIFAVELDRARPRRVALQIIGE